MDKEENEGKALLLQEVEKEGEVEKRQRMTE